jgi:hypothetical protein
LLFHIQHQVRIACLDKVLDPECLCGSAVCSGLRGTDCRGVRLPHGGHTALAGERSSLNPEPLGMGLRCPPKVGKILHAQLSSLPI